MEKANHRRVPTQDRGRQRFEEILDTAANVFYEKGFDSTTTNEIAERAGISIGSVYQYFDNKEAIVTALSERYTAVLRRLTNHVMATEVTAKTTTADAVGLLLDPIIEFHSEHPEFRLLWAGADFSPELRNSMRAMDDEVVARVRGLLEVRAPKIPRSRAQMVVTAMHYAVKSLLSILDRSEDSKFKKRAAVEAKRMLTAYVNDVIREQKK